MSLVPYLIAAQRPWRSDANEPVAFAVLQQEAHVEEQERNGNW